MAIAVVSSVLPGNIGKAGGPSAEGGEVAGADAAGGFASLLLGQQATAAQEGVLKVLTENAANDDQEQDTAEAPDAGWLLAALGLNPAIENQPRPSGDGEAFSPEAETALRALGGTNSKSRATADDVAADSGASPEGRTSDIPALLADSDEVRSSGAAKLAVSAEAKLPVMESGSFTTQPGAVAAHAPSAVQHAQLQAARPSSAVNAPLGDAAWPAEFSQKIVWMSRNDVQNAQITLNPPQLGPIEISLNVRNDQANAVFVSASPEVREAIEQALPRLREMFAGSGLELGQANVSAESQRQADERFAHSGNGGSSAGAEGARGATAAETSLLKSVSNARRGSGLVDTFA